MSSAEDDLPFWDHVEELRSSLIKILVIIAIGSALSFTYYEPLFTFLTKPLEAIDGNNFQKQLVFFSPVDGVMMTMKICLWSGVVFTSPIWLWIIFHFVLPGLNQKEQRLVIPFLTLSIALFTLGSLFSLNVTIPFANRFLYQFNEGIGMNLWSYTQYLDYTLMLTLATGLAFELFVVLFFFVHLGRLKVSTLRKYRKSVVIGTLVLGALFTPPDVITQCLLAFPLLILYEGVILYGRLLHSH